MVEQANQEWLKTAQSLSMSGDAPNVATIGYPDLSMPQVTIVVDPLLCKARHIHALLTELHNDIKNTQPEIQSSAFGDMLLGVRQSASAVRNTAAMNEHGIGLHVKAVAAKYHMTPDRLRAMIHTKKVVKEIA